MYRGAINIIGNMWRYAFIVMVIFCLVGLGAKPADVTGQWIAQIKSADGGVVETTFDFKVVGDKLTGTMSNQFGERQISEGKISGDDISFLMHIEFERNQINYVYKGKVSANVIRFTRERLRGGNSYLEAKFIAKRKTT